MTNPRAGLMGLLLLSLPVHADLLSVEDLAMLEVAKEQLTNIKEVEDRLRGQLQALDNQKRILEESQKLMQGHYGYGSLHENQSLGSWQHSGKDFASLLQSTDGGGQDALSRLAHELSKDFPLKPAAELYANPNSEQAKLYTLLAKTTLASRAGSTLTYNRIDEELTMLEALQKEIEKSPNQKATLDLIARIQIEEAKLVAYQLKAGAVSQQMDSLRSQQEVSDAAWVNQFFKWP